MYIRCTSIKSKKSGDPYYTYRLVESERVAGKVKQRTLLNLGRHFDLPKSLWHDLAARISQLISQIQSELFAIELPPEIEAMAQRYAAQILVSRSETSLGESAEGQPYFSSVDLDSLALIRPRKVGVEQLALSALAQLTLEPKLKELGFNRHQFAAAIGNIIGRMAFPSSERATHQWLQQTSGLGELIGYDFEGMGHDRLYQASDLLWRHREEIEKHLYQKEASLFQFEETITLYDLTNTFFEGAATDNPQAKRGRSKEKRSDCPLVTLGLVLDGSGFPRKSQIFSGNASEPTTLQEMLEGLGGRQGSIVILDAGIATEANIQWLIEQKYRYLVVSRKRLRHFDESKAVTVKEQTNQRVKVERVVNDETGEIELYCHSELREKKEQAMQTSSAERFEAALKQLSEGLSKKRTVKNYQKIVERLGRLKEKYARAAQHYEIIVEQDPKSDKAISIQWQRQEKNNSQASHPGVYCLRSNLIDWDEATLWRTYTMLTDLEGVFRSLKSELGMRPIYHRKQARVSGHIFITLLAYHLVQTLRSQLKKQGVHDSWQSIRAKMENQQRITVSLKQEDGQVVHLRQSSRAEPQQKAIYNVLKISPQPGKQQRTLA